MEMISDKLIQRYENECNEIKFKRSDEFYFLFEIRQILLMYEAFHIVAYRQGIP